MRTRGIGHARRACGRRRKNVVPGCFTWPHPTGWGRSVARKITDSQGHPVGEPRRPQARERVGRSAAQYRLDIDPAGDRHVRSHPALGPPDVEHRPRRHLHPDRARPSGYRAGPRERPGRYRAGRRLRPNPCRPNPCRPDLCRPAHRRRPNPRWATRRRRRNLCRATRRHRPNLCRASLRERCRCRAGGLGDRFRNRHLIDAHQRLGPHHRHPRRRLEPQRAPHQRRLEPRKIRRIAHQRIGQPQRPGIERPRPRHPEVREPRPPEILHRRQRAGPHHRDHATTSRTRTPGLSRAGCSRRTSKRC